MSSGGGRGRGGAGEGGALILLYHRITEVEADPHGLCVSPRHFAEHLEVIRRRATPLPLRRLLRSLSAGRPPRRAVVVTFDDGYADHLHVAAPLLLRHEVPATFFVAAGYVGSGREFWWDDLERLVLRPGTLRSPLRLVIDGRQHEWELKEAAEYDEAAFSRHRGWRAHEPHAPTPRHGLYRELRALLRPLESAARDRVLETLAESAGLGTGARESHRPLTPEELRALADCESVEIGAHTATHPVLAGLPPAGQRAEIAGGRERLEAILGGRVASFAYPFGAPGDYDRETIGLVREAGFDCACAAAPGVVRRGALRFELPRRFVWDCDGESFARTLDGWFAEAG